MHYCSNFWMQHFVQIVLLTSVNKTGYEREYKNDSESQRSVMLLPASLSFYHSQVDLYNWKMFHNDQKC